MNDYNLFRGASVVDGSDLRYSTARAISGGIGGGVGKCEPVALYPNSSAI